MKSSLLILLGAKGDCHDLPRIRGAAHGLQRHRGTVRAAIDHGATFPAVVASDKGSMIRHVRSTGQKRDATTKRSQGAAADPSH